MLLKKVLSIIIINCKFFLFIWTQTMCDKALSLGNTIILYNIFWFTNYDIIQGGYLLISNNLMGYSSFKDSEYLLG